MLINVRPNALRSIDINDDWLLVIGDPIIIKHFEEMIEHT